MLVQPCRTMLPLVSSLGIVLRLLAQLSVIKSG